MGKQWEWGRPWESQMTLSLAPLLPAPLTSARFLHTICYPSHLPPHLNPIIPTWYSPPLAWPCSLLLGLTSPLCLVPLPHLPPCCNHPSKCSSPCLASPACCHPLPLPTPTCHLPSIATLDLAPALLGLRAQSTCCSCPHSTTHLWL